MAEYAVVMVDCRMIDHTRHTERSEQVSEDVRVFFSFGCEGSGKNCTIQRYQGCPMNAWLIV